MMEFEAPDWRRLHSSLSRRRRFAFCPVGYYLHHVPGRDGYAEYADDWQYKIYAAKHMHSASGWVRSLFRGSLHKYFRAGTDFRRRNFADYLRAAFERRYNLLVPRAFEQDPKIVESVLEIERRLWSVDEFYERALYELNHLANTFMASWLFTELLQIPLLDFRDTESCWNPWQLGGVNFFNPPDLVWKKDRTLQILDLNKYFFEYEQQRAVLLYKVYASRFMSIAPEHLQVIFACGDDFYSLAEEDLPDFRQLFGQLSGEAAMWRDYLIMQTNDAACGQWHYAQLDKCSGCRFCGICPAQAGTAEPAGSSI